MMDKKDAIYHLLYMKHDVQAKSPMDIAIDTAIEALKHPTIEPEVRHGRWIPRKPDCRGYTEEFMCSECNAITYMHLCAKDCEYDFCPNCGAEMDGGADNGD